MGQSNSSSNNPRHSSSVSPASPPPPPPTRSRPLKTKKRSIVDHPALLSSLPPSQQPATTPRQPPSSPIPIPAHAGHPPPRRPTPPPVTDSFSTDLVPDLLSNNPRDEHSTHRPLQYNSTRSFGGVRRGAPQGGGWTNVSLDQQTVRQPVFMPEVVRSSIPRRIPQAQREPSGSHSRGASQSGAAAAQDDEATGSGARDDVGDDHHPENEDDKPPEGAVPTTIVWRGGGKEVFLAGTFDPLEWRARERLRFDPATSAHTLALYLPPGTYNLKFIVDDAWRCSDDMPTATDDETGNLVNYVDVEDSSALEPGDETQGRDYRVMKANRRRTYPAKPPVKINTLRQRSPVTGPRSPYHPPLLPPSESSFWADLDTDTELEIVGWGRGRDGVLEKWTSELPGPLMAAAHQEEAYISAVQAQREARRGGAGTRGTVNMLGSGVPAIPPAPRLPRHLDKVILNTKTGGASSSSGRSSRGKHRSRSSGVAVASSHLLVPPEGGTLDPHNSSSAAAMEQWAQADDTSVLPVPSHVVLHHLGTSAIKNGVLAVSDTTRYNKKYITTIYYKPI